MLGTLQSGIEDFGSTLDPYGPRTNVNSGKFVTNIDLSEFGENNGEP
jgi:hypothetical protein